MIWIGFIHGLVISMSICQSIKIFSLVFSNDDLKKLLNDEQKSRQDGENFIKEYISITQKPIYDCVDGKKELEDF